MLQNEQRLRVAQEAAHVGVWELDLATGSTWRSEECERINGLEPGSHVAHEDWLHRVHPDDRHLLAPPQAAQLREGKLFEVEFRIRMASGEERWLMSRGQLLCDADGRPARLIGINVDVTDRKRAEAELDRYRRELESRVAEHSGLLAERSAQLVRTQAALDRVGIGVAWNDAATGRFTYVNDETCRQLGYPREELLQLTLQDVNPEFTPERMRVVAAEYRGRDAPPKVEATFVRKDGSRYPVEITYHLDRTGGSEQFIAFYNDLTSRARLEETLRRSEQRWKFALEGAAQGVWDWDCDTGHVYFSPAYKRMLGYADEEFGDSAEDWSGRIHPDDRAHTLDAVERHSRGQIPVYDFEFRMRRRDGTYAWIQSRGMIVERHGDGRPHRIIGTHTDVTQRRLSQDALADAKRELEATLESMGAGFFACDADWRCLYINGEGERLLGLRREAILGRSLWDVLPLAKVTELEGRYRRAAAGESQDFEYCYAPWQRWFQSRCVPRKGGGISIYFREVTERKALDAALIEAKARAEAASAAKSAFLANMSHEIRTPLNGVIGMAHLLRLGGLSDEQAQRLDRLEQSANHLLEVLNAVLDLSKIEAGRVVLEELPLDVRAIVERVAAIVEPAATAKRLQVRTQLDEIPLDLVGDPTRLQQALLNYAGNAVKFTDRGSVTLRAQQVRDDGEYVTLRFEVVDTGPGIEPAVLKRLYATFEQGDASTTRRSGGTGLGLAITRKLAEVMGGDAGAQSTPGLGSTFWFTARCRRAPPPPVAGATAPIDAGAALRERHAGTRVLLAEDNDINREVAVALLEDAGLVVDTAEDGVEAVALAKQREYALVLMDVQMPRMDGLQATSEIRRRWPRGRLPIVAMTASAFVEDRARCEDAGMDDFIGKPFEPDELYALLLRWLETPRTDG
jgi:PAS domain S-box-containing protein